MFTLKHFLLRCYLACALLQCFWTCAFVHFIICSPTLGCRGSRAYWSWHRAITIAYSTLDGFQVHHRSPEMGSFCILLMLFKFGYHCAVFQSELFLSYWVLSVTMCHSLFCHSPPLHDPLPEEKKSGNLSWLSAVNSARRTNCRRFLV